MTARWEVLEDRRGIEVVDAGHEVELVRQDLRLPAADDRPPLGIERTVLPSGPTRGPVVLVHGLAQNRFTWRLSGRSFSGFLATRGFEVLNLELRGHGRSREHGSGNARAFDDYVDDLRRVLDRTERPAFVVGHSLGAGVGVAASIGRPTAGLVHLAGVWRFAAHNRTLRALARLTLAAEEVINRAPVRVRTKWAGDLLGRLYSITDIAGYGAPIAGWAPGSIERELLAERLSLGFDWTSIEVWLQMSRWARGEPFPAAEAFAELDRPLLVVAGDADPLVTPEDARLLYEASRSTDKELVIFEPFDHEVHWGHVDLILGRHAPRLVWPRIAAWLEARSPLARSR